MVQSSVQLTFPCPSCGHVLNSEGLSASGPCPTCQVPLTVTLSVTKGNAAPAADQVAQRINPIGHEAAPQLKFDERRFRPVLRLPSEEDQTAP